MRLVSKLSGFILQVDLWNDYRMIELNKMLKPMKKTMSRVNFDQLLEAGVHFGHLKRKWNPAMAPYIFQLGHLYVGARSYPRCRA